MKHVTVIMLNAALPSTAPEAATAASATKWPNRHGRRAPCGDHAGDEGTNDTEFAGLGMQAPNIKFGFYAA